ncbi:hypothetical protein [Serpentinicella alkaliphila]|uniref:Uncharacterized protein n=1 Tax=Serpentinicella alkaliphila TaxID=1734049 RepID=A0A4R2TME9_9FIRM|nr:hypothetical protein [Serpentinicella alkaliphila]QUH24557.1 hypothetical protein HZR23_01260 [Serpentinicella alkaliphila]TCQ04651.1 hypothetical protein EDD79_100654 [Serpentinicella alkaliphila]
MDQKIKSLEFMSTDRKIAYAKILALMLSLNLIEDKVIAFYRLLSQIRLNTERRMILLNYINNPKDEMANLCMDILKDLSEQEKNIVRFSLMKDLVILTRAGEVASLGEKKLFNKIKELFLVPDEYIGYFEEEYEQDQMFLNGNLEDTDILRCAQEQIALTSSIGIPATYLYYKGYLKEVLYYKKSSDIMLRLQRMGLIKRKRKKVKLTDLVIAVSLGVLSYGVANLMINKKIDTENELNEMIFDRAQKLHNRAISYLTRDIEYIKSHLDSAKDSEEKLLTNVSLLEKSLDKFKNSKVVLL